MTPKYFAEFAYGHKYKTNFRYVKGVSPTRKTSSTGTIGRSGENDERWTAQEFHEKLTNNEFPELNAPVKRIAVYKECTKGPVYHAMVMIESDDGFYCIERFYDMTFLRHAKDLDTLLKYGPAGEHRVKLLTKNVRGKDTIADVVKFAFDEGLSSKSYNLMNNNCQTFAQRIFGRFNAEGKTFSPYWWSKKTKAEPVRKSTTFLDSCIWAITRLNYMVV